MKLERYKKGDRYWFKPLNKCCPEIVTIVNYTDLKVFFTDRFYNPKDPETLLSEDRNIFEFNSYPVHSKNEF